MGIDEIVITPTHPSLRHRRTGPRRGRVKRRALFELNRVRPVKVRFVIISASGRTWRLDADYNHGGELKAKS
jgi:hypothetical protein